MACQNEKLKLEVYGHMSRLNNVQLQNMVLTKQKSSPIDLRNTPIWQCSGSPYTNSLPVPTELKKLFLPRDAMLARY